MNGWYTQEQIAIAKSNGISYQNLYKRVYEYGWDVERAITQPQQKGKPPTAYYHEYKELCNQNGIDYYCFWDRVHKQGMSPYDAATTPKRQGYREKLNAKITRKIEQIALSNGISINTLRYRVYKLKWTVEKACTHPVDKTKNHRSNGFQAKGQFIDERV